MEDDRFRRSRWMPIILIFIAPALIIGVVIYFLTRETTSPEEQEFNNSAYDITETEETLTSSLAAAAERNPHKDYQTDLSETKFSDLTASEFCANQGFSCSNILSQSLNTIPAINSNALDYYLDKGFTVVIDHGPYSTVVYGALHDMPNYVIFSTNQRDFSGFNYASKAELFNGLTGYESFYTLTTK